MTTSAVIRTLIVAILGWLVINRIIHSADHSFIFDSVIDLSIIIGSLLAYSVIAFRDRKEYKRTQIWSSVLPSIVGGMLIVILLFIEHRLSLRDKSPTILFASLRSDFNGVSLDFRADSTYKITDWCLGADIYRGKFRMKDSTIIIDRYPLGERQSILTDSLVIHWGDSTISLNDKTNSAIEEPFYIRPLRQLEYDNSQ